MAENNLQVQVLQRRTLRPFNINRNGAQIETTLTKRELRNALDTQSGQIAEMLGSLNSRLQELGLMKIPSGQNASFMRAVRENLTSIRQQTRATTAILDLPFREIPSAIKERMINGFKKTLAGAGKSPFTLAAYAGYHGIIMPIPVVIKHTGGLFYLLYCYFFVFVVIFGTRYYMIEYAEDERAQKLLNFAHNSFYYLIYPTKMLLTMLTNFIQVAIGQAGRNMGSILPALQGGIASVGGLAGRAVCSNVPRWSRWAVGC